MIKADGNFARFLLATDRGHARRADDRGLALAAGAAPDPAGRRLSGRVPQLPGRRARGGCAQSAHDPNAARRRLPLRLAAPGGRAGADDGRQRRDVRRRRGPAERAGGVRRRARRSVAAVHAAHGRLRHRRRLHGPACRPARHRRAALDRRDRARPRLRRRRVCPEHLDLRARARRPARPGRQLGELRAARRRHRALVRAPARHRGGDLRERQLRRRRGLAADRPALRRDRRLAPDLPRPRRLLGADDGRAGGVHARAPARARRIGRPRRAGASRARRVRSACR